MSAAGLTTTLNQRLSSSLNASAHSSDSSLHRVKNQPGYNTPVFKGKEEQRALVEQAVAEKARLLSTIICCYLLLHLLQ